MRPVSEARPVPAPNDWNLKLHRGVLHRASDLSVQRPGPVDLTVDVCAEINRMARQVARIHRLRRTGLHQLLLTLCRSQTFQNGEVHRRQFYSAIHDFDQIGVDAFEALD